jgi:hypothetical protein
MFLKKNYISFQICKARFETYCYYFKLYIPFFLGAFLAPDGNELRSLDSLMENWMYRLTNSMELGATREIPSC